MAIVKKDFTIEQGATFNPKFIYSQPTLTKVDINAISKSGRADLEAESHGVVQDGPVWIVGVVGMTRINHASDQVGDQNYAYLARFVDSDNLQLELDTSRFAAYVSGGELLYHPPVDLTGFKARMQVRRTKDSDETLVDLTTENGGIALGGTAGTIEPLIDSDTSAELAGFHKAVYDLELVDESTDPPTVTRFAEGAMRLSKEATR